MSAVGTTRPFSLLKSPALAAALAAVLVWPLLLVTALPACGRLHGHHDR